MNAEHIFIAIKQKTLAFIKTDSKGRILIEQAIPKIDGAWHDSWENADVFVQFQSSRLGQTRIPQKMMLSLEQTIWPMMFHDLAPNKNVTLKSLCLFFNIDFEHVATIDTATGECRCLYEVYWVMMRRYKMALIGEEVIRETGGRPVKFIRDLFGI